MRHIMEYTRISARIPRLQAEALQRVADRNDRSFSAELRLAIKHHLQDEQEGHPDAEARQNT